MFPGRVLRSGNEPAPNIDAAHNPGQGGAMQPVTSEPITTASLVALISAAAVGVLLSGCVGPPSGGASAVGAAKIVDGYDCLAPNLISWALPPHTNSTPDPDHPYAPKPGRVPHDFTPAMAVRCDVMTDLGDAPGLRVTAVTFAGDLAPLLAALAEPDDDDSNVACTADLELVPPLWLVDAAGRAINAHYPVNACKKTKPGVRDALDTLPVVDSTTVDIGQEQPVPTPDSEPITPSSP